MKSIAATILMLTIPGIVYGQENCSAALLEPGVYLSASRFDPEIQNLKEESKDLTLDLLRMTSFTRDSLFNEKEVVEKGTLLLGQPLKDGWSLEFEYVADHRGEDPIFRLKQTSLIKPNGERTALDKNALSLDNSSFNKSFFPIETLGLDIGTIKVEAPLVISGQVYKDLTYWATKAEFLRHRELQGLEDKTDSKKLRGKMWTRSTLSYTQNIVKKQSFKFAILGIAFYLYNNQERIYQTIATGSTAPWEYFEKQTRDLIATSLGRLIFENQLQQYFKITKKIVSSSADKEIKYNKIENILPKLENLNKIEMHSKSNSKIWVLDNGVLQNITENIDAFFNGKYSYSDSASILIHFPSQKRIVWLMAPQDTADGSLKFLAVGIDKGDTQLGVIYNSIQKKLD